MTKDELELYGENYLVSDDYRSRIKINERQELLRKDFVNNRFPLSFIKRMTLDDYVEGKNSTYKNSFCYILEFVLKDLGSIRGSFIKSKFVIHYSEEEKQYLFQIGKFGKEKDEVFENVRGEIVSLIEAGNKGDLQSLENNKLAPMFKGKIYYVYFPEKALPIYSISHINFFLRALEIPCDIEHEGVFEKREKLIRWKNNSKTFIKFTNLEFMDFLYSSFGFKKETDLIKKGIVDVIDSIEIITDKNVIDRVV